MANQRKSGEGGGLRMLQVNVRTTAELASRLKLTAKRLDVPMSDIVVDAVQRILPEYEGKADGRQKQRFTDEEILVAVRELLNEVSESDGEGQLILKPPDYKGLKGRAALVVLSALWGDSPPPWLDRALEKFAKDGGAPKRAH